LRKVCNAPEDKMGVYVIYALKNGLKELIYIGCSGKVNSDGSPIIRIRGMKSRLVDGKQFKEPRRKSWKKQMANEKIDALEIHWFVTLDCTHKDLPAYVEAKLIQEYFSQNGKLPRWNKNF
jgi:hypothetical protein